MVLVFLISIFFITKIFQYRIIYSKGNQKILVQTRLGSPTDPNFVYCHFFQESKWPNETKFQKSEPTTLKWVEIYSPNDIKCSWAVQCRSKYPRFFPTKDKDHDIDCTAVCKGPKREVLSKNGLKYLDSLRRIYVYFNYELSSFFCQKCK